MTKLQLFLVNIFVNFSKECVLLNIDTGANFSFESLEIFLSASMSLHYYSIFE